MGFTIGFEFECGWKPVHNAADLAKIKRLSKYQYFEEFILKQVADSLQNHLRDEYRNILSIVEDPTIKFSTDYKNYHYGVEVITKPMDESIATLISQAILEWMRYTPQIQTNESCGMHVNISFKDNLQTQAVDYISLLENTEQDKILELFRRSKNLYCQATHKRKFPILIGSRKTTPRNLEYWNRKIHKKSITMITTRINLSPTAPIYKTQQKIHFKDVEHAKSLIREGYLAHLLTSGKAISIVDKTSNENKRYFEFRLIGNQGYEEKDCDILSSIENFKNAMNKSLVEKKPRKPKLS